MVGGGGGGGGVVGATVGFTTIQKRNPDVSM